MLAALVAVGLATGCARGPLLGHAIRARGGPLPALARSVEATVLSEYPGTWRSLLVFQRPQRLAWTIETAADPNHYLFDGEAVYAWVGSAHVATDTDPSAPLRSYARFTAVMLLDVLEQPGVELEEVMPAALPPGIARGLVVRFVDDGARFTLGFDDDARLVRVEGPLEVPTVGRGEVVAELSDFVRVGGWTLPRRIRYRLGDRVLLDERALALCPDPPGLVAAAFRDPRALPACP